MVIALRSRVARAALALSLIAFVPTLAFPASFDCAAAHSKIEHAICDDPQLSALDSELANAYRTASARQGDDADQLKNAQREWLKYRAYQGKIDTEALRNAYRERIGELKAIPTFPAPGTPVEGPTYRLTKIAKQHDFVLRLLEACEAPDDESDSTCEGPAQLLIYGKGNARLQQTINLTNVYLTLPKGARGPLVNSARMYDYQGVINVGDFNFDGNEDFGIQTGNEGSYGGPSYAIFLFSPEKGRFEYNDALSGLIAETLGFFDVDTRHQLIRTSGKSGCCYHENTAYRIDHDVPVPVERHIEDALNSDNGKMKITDEKLVNGKWQSKVHYVPFPN
jgi:uncharacterized protein